MFVCACLQSEVLCIFRVCSDQIAGIACPLICLPHYRLLTVATGAHTLAARSTGTQQFPTLIERSPFLGVDSFSGCCNPQCPVCSKVWLFHIVDVVRTLYAVTPLCVVTRLNESTVADVFELPMWCAFLLRVGV